MSFSVPFYRKDFAVKGIRLKEVEGGLYRSIEELIKDAIRRF